MKTSASRVILRTTLCVLVSLGSGQGLRAQSVHGSVLGTIIDASGAVISGAGVTLTNTGTNEERQTQSDTKGNYQFVNLLPGTYSISVDRPGFKRFRRTSITVDVQSAVRIDASLQVGESSQSIEVTEQTPLLQTQTATMGQVVDSKQVEEIPLNGRNPINLAALDPAVVPQGGTTGSAAQAGVNGIGNYQIGGGTANQSATYLDGAPINISYVNSTALIPIQDSIQEFRVATNNVSPEFGRFAGGVLNMSTKSGTNQLHGALYEYIRNTDFNANTFFLNKAAKPRAPFTQNQYGAAVGGPIRQNRTFYFLNWEQTDLRLGTTTTTTVPTAAERKGDFSAKGLPAIFDPTTTCGTANNAPCAKDSSGNPIYSRAPFSGNMIPITRLSPAALNLTPQLWPLPNLPGASNNFINVFNRVLDSNEWNARIDHKLTDKQQLFARYTDFHRNFSTNAALGNSTGTGNMLASTQAVLGDTVVFSPTMFGDFRASFFRYRQFTIPVTCCNYNFATEIAPAWSQYQSQIAFPLIPAPNVNGMYNFNTIPIIFETDNSYSLSGSITKIIGRHTLKFGGEARRIEWAYAQSNSEGTTFNFDSGFTSQLPLAASGPGSPATSGFGFASWMLGTPSYGSAQLIGLSMGIQYYAGLYLNDTFRVSNKLTLNLGVRWEQPGSFHERYGSLTTMDLGLAQPALSTAAGRPITGGLALTNSQQYPHNDWQNLHWLLFSPRIGLAYSFDNSTVLRSGYGISYLPDTVAFSLGPYNSPVNSSISTMTTSLDGGLTPNPRASLDNPFPNGLVPPPGRSQAYLDSLLGQGIQSPLPDQRYPYMQQWNFDIQHQFGGATLLDVGYVGARGVHLPLYSINVDQLPNRYDSLGSALLNPVPNPFYGIIPASSGLLGQPTVPYGYLLKPYPQYIYMSADSASQGNNYYESLQVKVQKQFGAGGVFLASFSHSKLTGTADVLSPWLEANRFGVGGGYGVQDNNNIGGGEKSLSSFDVPNHLVLSYVLELPFGKGKRWLSGVHGVTDKLVSGWGMNGITTFQSGFPLALTDVSLNVLENDFAQGNAGPGTGAGVTRPNYVGGCNPVINGSATSRLSQWFNTSCYTVAPPFAFGNEPKVSPVLRAQGIDNFDFSLVKKTAITERINAQFRAEFFNLFNIVQFAPPGEQLGASTFGIVSAQYNQPRLIQVALRLSF
jgi:hypothetical protein